MAADEHAIVTALRTIYTGAFITTGGSKGGMTAVYLPPVLSRRRRRHGAVRRADLVRRARSALRRRSSTRSAPPTCRQAVRDVATEMLANRRAAMRARAQAQAQPSDYAVHARRDRAGGRVARSSASSGRSGSTSASTSCATVPAATATDDDAVRRSSTRSRRSATTTTSRSAQFEAYYYQAYYQLGYPDGGAAYLDAVPACTRDADYAGALPTAQPTYDGGAAMHDIDDFVQQQRRPAAVRLRRVGSVDRRQVRARRRDRLAAADPGRRARTARTSRGSPRRPRRRVRQARGVDRRDAELPPARSASTREHARTPRMPPGDACARCVRGVARTRVARMSDARRPRHRLDRRHRPRRPRARSPPAGMKVIVHGRSKTKVDAALAALREELPGAELEGVSFDLGTLAGVRRGAEQILARRARAPRARQQRRHLRERARASPRTASS